MLIRFGLPTLNALVALSLITANVVAAPEEAVGQSPTIRKILATRLITIGYREGAIPFSYLDQARQPIGYSIHICRRVVDALEQRFGLPQLQIKYVPLTPATRIPLVANGTVDLECGVTTNTLERQKSAAFSLTIFVAESRFVSKHSDNIQSLDDLRGKTVVSTVGTTSLHKLNALNLSQQLNLEILAGRDDVDSFQMLDAGRAHAYLMDDVLLHSLVASSPRPQDYVISQAALSTEPYALMLNKDDPAFKRVVDAALREIFARGELQQIYQKWFLQAIPPRQIQLNLSMSSALQHLLKQPTDSGNPADYR